MLHKSYDEIGNKNNIFIKQEQNQLIFCIEQHIW